MADAVVSIAASTLLLGSLYALLTAGMSLIWATLGVFNYAHGALLILGGYVVWTITIRAQMPVVFALLLALPIMATMGVLVELVAVRPFVARADGTLMVMVATLALAGAVEGLAQLTWGPQDRQLPEVTDATVTIAGVAVRATTFMSLALALGLVIGLIYVVNRTAWGASIRAVAQNREMATLLGIKPSHVYASVFAVAALLACAAAFVFASSTTLTPTKGAGPLLTAFVVLVFGGTASLWGTLVGAYVIGVLEAFTSYTLGLQWSPVAVFGVLVIVMIARPEGMIGRRTS